MQTQTVELLKPHTHAGTLMEPGDVIDLPVDLAHWLIDSGIAQPHKVVPATKSLSKTEEST